MGTLSIVHGRILLKSTDSYQKATETIKNVSSISKGHYFLQPDMFSLGSEKRCYFQPVISFAATYKSVEYDWTAYMLVFENLLRYLDFDTVKLQLEVEIGGNYNFFWHNKNTKREFRTENRWIETDEWYFGMSYRDMNGIIEKQDDYEVANLLSMCGFQYPMAFDETALKEFNQVIEKLEKYPLNTKIYLNQLTRQHFKNFNRVLDIMTYLALNNEIEYGYDTEKRQDWLKKLKAVKPVVNTKPR